MLTECRIGSHINSLMDMAGKAEAEAEATIVVLAQARMEFDDLVIREM